jgi:hypothetical protein
MNKDEIIELVRRVVLVASAIVVGTLLHLFLAGCSIATPQKKGTMTIEDRGAKLATERGDPLMQTGIYAKQNVPADYATGYQAGMTRVIKDEYWDEQHAQRWLHFNYMVPPHGQRSILRARRGHTESRK